MASRRVKVKMIWKNHAILTFTILDKPKYESEQMGTVAKTTDSQQELAQVGKVNTVSTKQPQICDVIYIPRRRPCWKSSHTQRTVQGKHRFGLFTDANMVRTTCLSGTMSGGFQSTGGHPVTIHFRLGLSLTKSIQRQRGSAIYGNPHVFPLLMFIIYIYIYSHIYIYFHIYIDIPTYIYIYVYSRIYSQILPYFPQDETKQTWTEWLTNGSWIVTCIYLDLASARTPVDHYVFIVCRL